MHLTPSRRKRTALVSVLDWGLGHASRTSVIVRRLVERGDRVVLAGSGRSLALLCSEFPDLQVVTLPSFSPVLSRGRNQWFVIMLQVPKFLFCIIREHFLSRRIVRSLGINLIISDNRYGLFNQSCPSVLITHQLHPHISPSAPRILESLLAHILKLFLRKFTGVVVPDVSLSGLSGNLSAPMPGVRAHPVGLLSRLASAETVLPSPPIEWLGIASGPEPQRSIFIDILSSHFADKTGRRVIVCGTPDAPAPASSHGVEFLANPSPSHLKGLILSAEHIFCRSGYSTVMDLVSLGKRATLVPTPGQAEQEYLASHLSQYHNFANVSQEDLMS